LGIGNEAPTLAVVQGSALEVVEDLPAKNPIDAPVFSQCIGPRLTPASAASRICIRLSRRTGSLPALTKAPSSSRSDWLRSTRYRMFIPKALLWGRVLGESTMNQSLDRATAAAAQFTAKQGQYLAFIWAYSQINGRAPAEAGFQRYFKVTAPSVHQMLKTLDQLGLIDKQLGVARSIKLLVPPQRLPILGLD
jgi:hypothetical protein